MRKPKTYHLSNILDLKSHMKIVIDDTVQMDSSGDYLINVGYLRVSTDRQADLGFGLDIQESDITRYCQSNGYSNLVLFIDDGYTGTNMDRPALQSIIDYIKAYNEGRTHIRIDSLVVAKIDRLGRTLLGTLQFIQDYIVCQKDSKNSSVNRNKEDINFVSVAENYCRIDKNNPQGKFLLMLFATLAEFDRDLIVEKMRRGRTARVASGKWIGGGNVPFGYRYDKEKSALVVVPEKAKIVQEIYRLYVEEQMVPQKIAERFGFSSDAAIFQILRRKSLTGVLLFNGEEYKGNHEAIISPELWERAQEELNRRGAHRTASTYLLSGLVSCGECGAKMRYQKWGKNGAKLICYSQIRSAKKYLIKDANCSNGKYWADAIEEAVTGELFRLAYLGDEANRKSSNTIDPIAVLEKQLRAERRRLSRLYDFEDDDGNDDVLREKIFMVKKRISSIQAQIQDEQENATIDKKVNEAKETLRTLSSTWPNMTDVERQAVCQKLIDRIIVQKDGVIDVHLKLREYLENADKM